MDKHPTHLDIVPEEFAVGIDGLSCENSRMQKNFLPLLTPFLFSIVPIVPARAQATLPGMESAEVSLRDPGAEPRHAIQIQPDLGKVQNLRFEVSTQDRNPDVFGIPTPVPEFHFELSSHAEKRALPLGGFRLVNEVTQAFPFAKGKMLAKHQRAMVAQIGSMKGSQVILHVNAQGLGDGYGFQPAPNANQDFSEALPESMIQLHTLAVSLPLSPIGVGATWDAKLTLPINGVVTPCLAHYTLKSLANGIAGVEGTLEGQPELAKFPSPFPPEPKLFVKSVQMSGTLTATLDLSKGMPIEAQVQIRTLTQGLPPFTDGAAAVRHESLLKLTLHTVGEPARP